MPWRKICGWLLVAAALMLAVVAMATARWEVAGESVLAGIIGTGLIMTENESER